jgi:alkyl hydroperoxide reductase subunit AhpC
LKKYLLLFTVSLLVACGNPNIIEFDIKAPGLTNATFIVKDDAGKSVFGANVIDGKCYVKSSLEAEGFYTFDIVKNGSKQTHVPFEVFLEPGKYTITADPKHLGNYPQVVSQSKRQKEISDYHQLINTLGKSNREVAKELDQQMVTRGGRMSPNDFNALNKKLDEARMQAKETDYLALEKFIKQNPKSEFAARFMGEQTYDADPVKYYTLYKLMSDAAKNSPDGKAINARLTPLLKLLPGQSAPPINGRTFDGKTFAQITAGKKVFLIDFWRAGNEVSRMNHEEISAIYAQLKGRGFEIISVSLDSKPDWWTTAVKDDKLPWPQMADLKGSNSPNVLNWGVSTVPTYHLVDSNWKIIALDVSIANIVLDVNQYLAKHP